MITITTLPQDYVPIVIVTIQDLVSVMPQTLLYPFNVWISGSLARDGKATGSLTFLIEGDGDPTSEIMNYFNTLVQPLGVTATAAFNWKNKSLSAIRLYNNGQLIVNPDGSFKEFPAPINEKLEITIDYVYNRLPQTIKFKETLYLTGGLTRDGFSLNDVDIMLEPTEPKTKFYDIKKFFTQILGVKVDVGNTPMIDREPIYLFKMYENGELCPR